MHSKVEIHTSRGKVVRVYGADNDAVNDGWLSDKDRFSFPAVHADDRVTTPLVATADGFAEATWPEAIDIVAARLGSCIGTEVGCIGGANNTNEEAYVLSKFMRSVIGTPHIDAQLGDGINAHLAAAVTPRARLSDLDSVATIFVWGPDLKETLPVLYLRVRKAVRNGANLVVASPAGTGLDGIATHVIRYRTGSGQDTLRKLASGDGDLERVLELLGSGPVVTLFGRASISEDERLAEAVAAFARTLDGPGSLPLLRRGNIFGALDMGLANNLLPGRVSTGDAASAALIEDAWGLIPQDAGLGTMDMLEAAVAGDIKAIFLVGADPVRDCPDPDLAIAALEAAEFVIAFDAFVTDSSIHADLILPAAMWSEVDGTVTNIEGRVQAVHSALPARGRTRSLIGTLSDVAFAMGANINAHDVALVSKEIASVAPAYAGIDRDFLIFEDHGDGVVVPWSGGRQPLGYIATDVSVPLVTDRFTLHFPRSMYDDGVTTRHAPSISNLVKTPVVRINPRDASMLALDDGSIVELAGSILMPAQLDPQVAEGSVVVPFNVQETKGLKAAASVAVRAMRGEG